MITARWANVGAITTPPVTKPVVPPTVATGILLLLHVPPPVVLLSCVVRPEHIEVTPVIGAGSGFTVTVVVTRQPVAVSE